MWMGYALAGFLSGIISGMGIGGGAVLIPAMTFIFAMGQREAQQLNLLYFLPTAALALVTHVKNKNVEKKNLPRLIIFGLIGASLGSALALWFDAGVLRRGFGIFLLGMGINELVPVFIKTKNMEREDKPMELKAFEKMKSLFSSADTETKIDMYVSADGLTQWQYKELLRLFPLNELNRLEEALG